MKKHILKISTIIFVILFSLIFFRENLPAKTHSVYQLQKSVFEKFDCKNKIVFIGDSITSMCQWNELLSRNDVVNRGISGDSTFGLLYRLDFIINQKPKCIFIMIGFNDFGNNLDMDTVKENYSTIIDKILSNKIQLFVESTLFTSNIEINKRVKILNDYLVEQCKLKSIQYIDVNSKLLKNNILSPKYSIDGYHLNGNGYIILKKVILPYINKVQ